MESEARYGWESDFPRFYGTPLKEIRGKLLEFICDASPEQVRAWDDSIPKLQREVGEVVAEDTEARTYSAILEYELPMESRRPDVILLVRGAVVVLELKGKDYPSQADVDQASAYARDLQCYHRECAGRTVVPVVVPTRARGRVGEDSGVHIVGPDALDELIEQFAASSTHPNIPAKSFLAEDAYRPLPTLVKAARELFHKGDLRSIHRARAATDPAVREVSRIIHEAARTRSRRLILVTGVPGAGKTLVGLRTVHAHFLDDLAVPRADGKPNVPAVFLSGNNPLVQVLQYELRSAGGGGKAFVRHMKDYVKRYASAARRVPPEHVLVFDEAQRAFDADQVQAKHRNTPGFEGGKSEPEHFIEFAERVPEWCVVLGLIGVGQEIHVGEEAGLVQWRHAVEGASQSNQWKVHGPPATSGVFAGSSVSYAESNALNLDTEIRYHLASDVHEFVTQLLKGSLPERLAGLAHKLQCSSYHLRITRDLEVAKEYLRERYASDPEARFGLLASSRDRDLERFGVANGYNATKSVRFGPWYSDPEDALGGRSCRLLAECVTEFGAQGLELDAVLLAWGTDLRWTGRVWSSDNARRYQRGSKIKDPHQLRLNAYRVLLTRGRDGTVVFVPDVQQMDATYEYLLASGFRHLEVPWGTAGS
jgi:hypothetical protein